MVVVGGSFVEVRLAWSLLLPVSVTLPALVASPRGHSPLDEMGHEWSPLLIPRRFVRLRVQRPGGGIGGVTVPASR